MFQGVLAISEAFPRGILAESLWEGWGHFRYSVLLTLEVGFGVLDLAVKGLSRGRLFTRVLPYILKPKGRAREWG